MSPRNGVKGLLLDALRYQETLDPIRPAIFQTVSLSTRVNKGKKWAARWEVTRTTTKVCRRNSTREGVYDCRVCAFVSRRQLAYELFQHRQVVLYVLAGGHRGCRPRADERLPHASVGKVDASADSLFWAPTRSPGQSVKPKAT